MKPRFPLYLVVAVFLGLFSLPRISSAQTEVSTAHLLRELKGFPYHATPYVRVNRVMCALTKRNIFQIKRYFTLAKKRVVDTEDNRLRLYQSLVYLIDASGQPDNVRQYLMYLFTGSYGYWANPVEKGGSQQILKVAVGA